MQSEYYGMVLKSIAQGNAKYSEVKLNTQFLYTYFSK